MSVTRIEEYQARDIIQALQYLLSRVESGRVRGLAFAIKVGPKRHQYGFLGDYRSDPAEALGCVTRMEYKVNQLMSAGDHEPETRNMPL